MCTSVMFFVKKRTAYEMRISDWSSDVCSSDLSSRRRERSGVCAELNEPLCTIARWNRPRADGIAIRVETFAPPPDWPKIVTQPGSPPKPAILSNSEERRVGEAGVRTCSLWSSQYP